jgi:hypothetical protein
MRNLTILGAVGVSAATAVVGWSLGVFVFKIQTKTPERTTTINGQGHILESNGWKKSEYTNQVIIPDEVPTKEAIRTDDRFVYKFGKDKQWVPDVYAFGEDGFCGFRRINLEDERWSPTNVYVMTTSEPIVTESTNGQWIITFK